MQHTTHYAVIVNHVGKIITLLKPLEFSIFAKDPHAYCEAEDTKTGALIHYSHCREEHYFRNLADARKYFTKLKKSKYYEHFLFNDVFDEM